MTTATKFWLTKHKLSEMYDDWYLFVAYFSPCYKTAANANYWMIRTLFIAIITLGSEESAAA